MSTNMMIVNYSGPTYQYDANGNIISQTGTGPDYVTLVSLTLPQCVYEPGAVWNVLNAQNQYQPSQGQLILIYDAANDAAIRASVSTITGANIISFPITYTQNQIM